MKKRNSSNSLNWWGNFKYSVYDLFRRMGEPFRKKQKRKFLNKKHSAWLFAYLILLLPAIYFLIFYVGVNLNSFKLAFTEIGTGKATFQNFIYVFESLVSGGSSIFLAIRNTAIFWGLGWLLMPVNIIVSFLLYKKLPGYKVFQIIFYLPSIISGVVWMTAYKNFIMPSGPLCSILVNLGIYNENFVPEFLHNSDYALQAVLASNIWLGIPANMLIYCGSLARIPHEVIEAGKLDGVGFWQEIVHITLPLLGPLLGTQVVLHFISMLNSSGNILLLTEGEYGTTTLNYWMYEQIVVGGSYNIPSAMGLVCTFFTIPFVVFGRWITNKIENIEY